MGKYFPLTEAQKRIWYSDALFPRTSISNVAVTTEFKNLDEELLKKSIDLFVSHNDIIRVRLLKQYDQEPVQYISNEPLISTKVLDLSIYSENQLNLWFQEQAKQPIPLYESNLYEFTIINWHDKSFLLVKCHHIIIDGMSIDALLLNIRSIYESLRSHSEIKHLSKYTLHQYTTSEKEYKQSARFQKDNQFWQSEFESIPEYLIEKTNALYSRSLQAKRKEYKIPDTTKILIEKFCQENQISIYTFLMSVLFIYFSRTENENDFVIGTYLANRKRKENDVLGMFVSTLPFRMEVFNEIQTLEFIKSLSKKQLKLMRHQKYPYNQLIQDLRKKGNDINQLFTVGVEYQEMEADFHQVFSGHDFNGMNFHIKNYTLKEQLVINIDYRTELFPDYEIEYLIGRLFVLIRDIIQFPEKNIGELSVCTKEERRKILNEFNDTKMPYPKEKTIHSLFEEQVEKDPHQVAVVFQEKQLTYKELNKRANRLARVLRQRGVTSEDRVGLLMERSLDMIVGMLAILKAGGAYLPIDPAYPAERIDYMLEDSGSKIVLSQTEVIEQLWEEKQWEGNCLDVRKIDFEGIDESNLTPVNQSRNLAYVMYTSGTTGRPKGVEVIHQNVVRLVKDTNYATLNEKQVLLQLAPIAFDASTFEIWGSLLNRAKLVMIGSNRPTLEEIAFTLEHEKITTMFLTTALFNTMVDHQLMALKGVQQLLMGGETVSVPHVKKALSLNSLQLVHVYGPTENTTFSSYYVVPETWEEESTIPIGKPINNTKIFILDERAQVVPLGVVGEIYTAGEGVARGYLNRPELTKEKFVPNPFSPGEKMYRTGDLARYLPDGNIEFLGRIDHQVKIRGYRIELGEIESTLLEHPNVKDATVMDWKEGENEIFLCAYVVLKEPVPSSELRDYLSQKLPAYMVPSFFEELDTIPLTSNGKIDRKVLPKPDISNQSKEYVAPTTELEKKLVEIWQEVLGIEQIGVTDHFFEIGGDSIKAIQIASMLQKADLTISVNHLLYSSTIRNLIPYIKKKEQRVNQDPIQGEVPLTPIQLEFFEREQSYLDHFNQSMLLFSSENLEESLVSHVLEKLVEHHDALRMIYIKDKDKWVQFNREIKNDNIFEFDVIDLNGKNDASEKIENESNKSQGGLNISKGPLMKITLFKTNYGDYLLFVIHHLVIDGVSWRILLEDFECGCKQAAENHLVKLPLKTHSFMDWSNVLNIYSESKELLKEVNYWRDICQTKLLPLKKDRQTTINLVKDSDDIIITLTKKRTKQLLSQTHYAYNTEINDILLTALGITLSEWMGTDKIGVLLEGHGREEIHDEFSFNRTIGWFTSCFPVVLNFSDSTSNIILEERLSYYIKNVKEILRNIPNRGIGYGVLKYLSKEGLAVNNIDRFSPEIVFNYLGQFDRGSETYKDKMFEISSLHTGGEINPNMKRNYTLEMNGYVLNKQLTFLISYSNKQYDKGTISELAENFKMNLERIIEHCLNKTKSEKTPSDLGDKDLSIEELDYMRSMLETKGSEY